MAQPVGRGPQCHLRRWRTVRLAARVHRPARRRLPFGFIRPYRRPLAVQRRPRRRFLTKTSVTVRHYYTDAYRTEFAASVVERGPDGRRVYLDETAFYPTSGGQPHDLGTLGGVRVVDVVDEDSRIAHVLESPLGASGERLIGRIDWTRRYDHMQQHTGQHLLSAVFENLFGARTVSVHFGPESSTLDLDAESITRDQLARAEARA